MERKNVKVEILKCEDLGNDIRLLEDGDDENTLILINEEEQMGLTDSEMSQNEIITMDPAEDETIATMHLEDVQSDESYSCISCGITFTCLQEHIAMFHSDQEVVIEMSTEEAVEEAGDSESILPDLVEQDDELYQNADEDEDNNISINFDSKRIIMETGEIVTTSQPQVVEVTGERWRTPQILNTLHEEQCVDRDGRWYTRKVVQIERFWDTAGVKADNSNANLVEDKLCNTLEQDFTEEEIVGEDSQLEEEGVADLDSDDPAVSRIYHCTSCNHQYYTMPEFESHVCNPIAGKYKCDHCSVSYSSSRSLCAHMKVHKGLKSAEKKSSAKSSGQNQDVVVDTVGPFKCGVCDTVFPSNKSLRLHRRMHEPARPRPTGAPAGCSASSRAEHFHCQLCDKWIHVGYRRIHEAVHSGDVQHNCHICNRKFYTKENLAMHVNVHNVDKICAPRSEKTLPYECNFCNRQFARPHEKVKHERIHTGEKPHSCDICGKSFRVSYCLTLHMRTHTGARPYVCEHCGKRFKAHSVYNHHLLTHSDVRAYKCPFCIKAFKTSVQLAGHKNSHTKPFSCTECNRPFASLYAVRIHMETHKRQNNLKFNCQLCGASYARAFALRDHLKSQHELTNEFDKDMEPETNVAALSILPKDDGLQGDPLSDG